MHPARAVCLPIATALCLALAPASAQAFPFIVAGAGASLLPLAAAAGAAFVRRRFLAPLLALVAVLLAMAWPAQPEAYRDRMRTDSRLLETAVDESRLPRLLNLPGTTPAQAISYAQARTQGAPLAWVDHVPAPGQRGRTLAQLAGERPALPPGTVFLSDGSGDAARHAAALTGLRWSENGLFGIAQAAPREAPADVAVQAALPDCRYPQCLRVGVVLSHEIIWNGFARGLVDRSWRIEDFLLPGRSPRQALRELSRDGALPVHVAFFGTPDLDTNLRWSHIIRPHFSAGFTLLENVTAANELSLAAQMESYIGAYQPDLAASDVVRQCERGQAVLVTPHHPHWQRVTRIPGALADCPLVQIPVEGLLPEEVLAHVAGDGASLAHRLGRQRIVGLYLDESDHYALSLLREALQAHGYAWSGKTFGYAGQASDPFAPATGLADTVLESLRLRLGDARGVLPSVTLVAATALPMLGLGIAFAGMRRRGLAALLFLAQLLMAALWLRAHAQLPVHPVLPAWSAPALLATVFAFTAVCAGLWQARRARGWSKASGLATLRRWGLRVPRGQVLRHAGAAACGRAARRTGYPAIFRSHEQVSENRHAPAMGEHRSVVVRSADDLRLLPGAWQDMARTPGARPAFLVQPWLAFETCGVVRTGLMVEGRPHAVIERSTVAEGVTGNRSAAVETVTLDIETCACARDPLLQDIARIQARHPAPLLLEYGVLRGQPVWLQLQHLPASDLLLYDEASHLGFTPSPLQAEFTPASRGRAFVLSLLDGCAPARRWRLQGGQVFEQPCASAPAWTLLAHLLPWPLFLRASGLLLRHVRARLARGVARLDRRSLAWARAVLVLDGLLLLKGPSARVVEHPVDVRVLQELAGIDSPFGQFAELAAVHAATREAPAPLPPQRLRASFAAREQLRQALCYALAPLSAQLQARLAAAGFSDRALDAITVSDIDWHTGQPRPDPALIAQDDAAPVGLRQPGAVRVQVDSADDIEAAREHLSGVTDATVVAARPWLGLFSLTPHVACFQIRAAVHRNSHFMQRACALGIAVRAVPPDRPVFRQPNP